MEQAAREKLIQELLDTGCLKFGQFTLKSGEVSHYYIDLRESTLHNTLFHYIVESLKNVLITQHTDRKDIAIVGIPYGVVPVAAVVAYELKIPYYPVRKEVKAYGNKTECNLLTEHKYILIEDVMSTGSSIIETIKKLEGKKITDVMVIVDREAGGYENLKAAYPNIKLHSILKASDILKMDKK